MSLSPKLIKTRTQNTVCDLRAWAELIEENWEKNREPENRWISIQCSICKRLTSTWREKSKMPRFLYGHPLIRADPSAHSALYNCKTETLFQHETWAGNYSKVTVSQRHSSTKAQKNRECCWNNLGRVTYSRRTDPLQESGTHMEEIDALEKKEAKSELKGFGN